MGNRLMERRSRRQTGRISGQPTRMRRRDRVGGIDQGKGCGARLAPDQVPTFDPTQFPQVLASRHAFQEIRPDALVIDGSEASLPGSL